MLLKESNEIIFPGIRVVLWLLADLLFEQFQKDIFLKNTQTHLS